MFQSLTLTQFTSLIFSFNRLCCSQQEFHKNMRFSFCAPILLECHTFLLQKTHVLCHLPWLYQLTNIEFYSVLDTILFFIITSNSPISPLDYTVIKWQSQNLNPGPRLYILRHYTILPLKKQPPFPKVFSSCLRLYLHSLYYTWLFAFFL